MMKSLQKGLDIVGEILLLRCCELGLKLRFGSGSPPSYPMSVSSRVCVLLQDARGV